MVRKETVFIFICLYLAVFCFSKKYNQQFLAYMVNKDLLVEHLIVIVIEVLINAVVLIVKELVIKIVVETKYAY